MANVAILTGDLVGSTRTPDAVTATMAVLAETAETLARQSQAAAPAPRFTRFRGDGWQFCTGAALALRAALLVAARLHAADLLTTRIAIGIGTLSGTGTRDLSDASGPAVTASGHALDRMPRRQLWAIAGETPPWAAALVALGAWHSARWSREQAEAMAVMLAQPALTQAEAANRTGITRQAWQARLSGAGYAAWLPALQSFESGFDV